MQQVVVCGRNFRVMRTTPSATLTAPAAATGEDDNQAEPMPSDHTDVQAGAIRDANVLALGAAYPARGGGVSAFRSHCRCHVKGLRHVVRSAVSGQVQP